MGRYFTTLRVFWIASLTAELEYKANFLIELVATAGNLVGSLFVLSLFYGRGQSLGGWSWEAALVVLGVYTLLEGITSTLLQPNLSTIVAHVRTGSLDFVLLKPIDSQFWLSARTFSPWGLPGIVLGAALIGFGWIKGADHIQAQWDAAVQQQTQQDTAVFNPHGQIQQVLPNGFTETFSVANPAEPGLGNLGPLLMVGHQRWRFAVVGEHQTIGIDQCNTRFLRFHQRRNFLHPYFEQYLLDN